MTLLGPLATPLRTLAFALGGALLAWAWFNVDPLAPVLAVAAVWVIVVLIQSYAESIITSKPKRALTLFELRLLGIVTVSAGGAALAIVLTVWFTLDEEAKKALPTSTEETLAAVGAALIAFVGAVSVSAEAADENIGELVKTKFREKFVVDREPGAGQRRISTDTVAGRKADRALNSVNDYGWEDWLKQTRKKRVEAVEAYLNPPR